MRTILSLSESGRNPQRENHQALDVKGERHPTCGTELNPDSSNRTQPPVIAVRGQCVTTAPPNLSILQRSNNPYIIFSLVDLFLFQDNDVSIRFLRINCLKLKFHYLFSLLFKRLECQSHILREAQRMILTCTLSQLSHKIPHKS